MTKVDKFYFDENKHPYAWAFNDEDYCNLSDEEKRKILFLDKEQSSILWDIYLPFKDIMRANCNEVDDFFQILDETIFDYSKELKEYTPYFLEKLKDVDIVYFLWSRHYAVILPKNIFVKIWDTFFYITENDGCFLMAPNHNVFIFGSEKMCFGNIKGVFLKKQQAQTPSP